MNINLIGTGQVATLASNKKPRIIITIEKLIWDTIFAVARGNVDLLKAIENLAESFPWMEVEAENQIDWVRHWFDSVTDYEVAAMGVSGQSRSDIFQPEDRSSNEISMKDLEMEGENHTDHIDDLKKLTNDDDGLHHEMDIDFMDATSSPTEGPRVTIPRFYDQTSPLFTPERTPPSPKRTTPPSPERTPPLFTPERTPDVLSRQPLFLPEDGDQAKSIHVIQRAPFLNDLISKEYCVYDNHYERHMVTTIFWVSGGLQRCWDTRR